LVDTTTLIVISTIVQTIVITVTLIIFVLQFRSQEQAIREASYQGLMGRYNDFVRTTVETPAIARLLIGDEGGPISDDDAAVYAHLLVAYGIIEEAFLLHAKKWITDDDWKQWSAFFTGLATRPQMKVIHDRTLGTFDRRFEAYATQLFNEIEDSRKKVEEKIAKANEQTT
jgi:hypothetical protein